MDRYVALIRGINVGSAKRIAMADLRDMVSGLGCENVATYIASGNLVCDSAIGSAQELADAIGSGIADTFGFDASVVVLTAAELESVAATSPYLEGLDDLKHLIVTVLDAAPDPTTVAAIDRDRYLPETFEVVDRSIHIHAPDGQAQMQLVNAFWEKTLAQTATTRTWRTMQKIRELI